MKQSKIRLDNVSASYGSADQQNLVQVLHNVNLDVQEGEFVSIVGPSGCGKSTILNLAAGLWSSADGAISGSIKVDHADRKQTIGYVLQKDALFPWRTLIKNVEYPLEITGLPRKQREEIAREWIDRVGLAGFEDRYPYQLSGGMRQRANIIRVLAYDPEIVLMDEPLGALDAHTRMVLQQQISDLWSASRKTVVFVTHDLEEAILLSTRVVLMTKRPATVSASRTIDLPYPRTVMNLKLTPEFRNLYENLWHEFCDLLR
ncbi:MAG: ABC transporter ATP-binding protein [Xanthobacteraceae bacterium]|nr:ABC transporter ATP-binding protein [Xanthobacteraceae bacterium]MBX3533444.1 ABC transporter ATP-binding protein [Xanthobacteraceae bacterium]MCW5676384.1 ABC transporter ATP-binding protein [Xanthobacteraceae bacterium]